MTPTVEVQPDATALFRAAADRVIRIAGGAVGERGVCALALSGGSTPKRLYEQLAEDAADVGALLWRHVHFFWGDERVVPPDHADSNFRMAREAMLDRLPIDGSQIHRMQGEVDARQAAAVYERDLIEFFQLKPGEWPRFDLVLLGLGPDGHTASLFPGTNALAERERIVVANHVPKLDVDRITLTAPTINHARDIVFLADGAGKAAMVRAVIEGPREPERLPAQLVRPDDGTLTWMLDAAAAAELTSHRT